MRNRFLMTSAALVLGLALVGAACSSDDESADETTTTAADESTTTEAETSSKTIVVLAQEDPEASTLVKFVTAAGLAATLSGEGPFTVMAPTNEAFAAVPADTVAALEADPTGALADVLKLHVIQGEIDSEAAAAAAGTCVETLGGPVLVAEDAEGNLTFGGAKILRVDVSGSNGIIHFIDGVVTEPSTNCPTN